MCKARATGARHKITSCNTISRMKKFIKDTKIMFTVSSYLRHIEELLMTSSFKKSLDSLR